MRLPEPSMPGVRQSGGIYPSDGGTCNCDYSYGPSCTSKGGCNDGFYADCETSTYSCGCSCKPVGG